jgi:hypothetical protein
VSLESKIYNVTFKIMLPFFSDSQLVTGELGTFEREQEEFRQSHVFRLTSDRIMENRISEM